ncbi:hypothetical protein Q3C01_39585, partial [Bradyrhizobium sp. UFLA05-109]
SYATRHALPGIAGWFVYPSTASLFDQSGDRRDMPTVDNSDLNLCKSADVKIRIFAFVERASMTSQLDLWPLLPWLFLAWVGGAFVAIAGLAIDEYRSHLPERPLLSAAWQCARIGIFFTIYLIGSEVYSHELISLSSFVLTVVGTILVLVGTEWLTARERKADDDTPPGAS